jgi:hypothetical protein
LRCAACQLETKLVRQFSSSSGLCPGLESRAYARFGNALVHSWIVVMVRYVLLIDGVLMQGMGFLEGFWKDDAG